MQINIMIENYIQQLSPLVKDLFSQDSSWHDIYHLDRVLNNALSIQEKEGGDRVVIGIAAFLHDVHRIIQKESWKFCSPKDPLPTVSKMLEHIDIDANQKENILHCIEYHEEYNFSEWGKTVSDIETLVLQDADNLDAIGAIGVWRTFSYGGAHGVTMRVPEKPFDRATFDEAEEDPSTIHHFYSKLLKLKDNMNTQTALQMAAQRHQFMETFLQQFFDEWNGKK